jgi:hypothetical protein
MSIDGFLYSKSTTKLSKTNNPLRYKTILDPRHQSDQDRLVSSQEKNTNPTQGVGPLSRDSQDMESAQSVNKKSTVFLLQFSGAYTPRSLIL